MNSPQLVEDLAKLLFMTDWLIGEKSSAKTVETYWQEFSEEAKSGHFGDCTKAPRVCSRCFQDRYREAAALLLDDGKAFKPGGGAWEAFTNAVGL